MKAFYTLILVVLAGTAYGQSSLPACRGTDISRWDHCYGSWTFSDGDNYTGEWGNGRLNGQGVATFGLGGRYTGQFIESKRNGQGTFLYPNGDKYEGEWRSNKWHGRGTHILANGNKYVGDFKDDYYEGYGIFYYLADNDLKNKQYEGEFKNGTRDGQGQIAFTDGRISIGEWRDNKPDGKFIEYRADGSVFRSGLFNDGKLFQSEYIDPNSFTRIVQKNVAPAISETPQKNNQSNTLSIDNAKSKCEELGFKTTTEGFGKCVLQLTK